MGDGTDGTCTEAGGANTYVQTDVTVRTGGERENENFFFGMRISGRCRHRKGPTPQIFKPTHRPTPISPVALFGWLYYYGSKQGNKGPGHGSFFLSLSSIVPGGPFSIVRYLGGATVRG